MSSFSINPKKIKERFNRLASVGVRDGKLKRAVYTPEDTGDKDLVDYYRFHLHHLNHR